MGDAGFEEAEDSIMAAGYDLKSTVLKVGHSWQLVIYGHIFLEQGQAKGRCY